MSWKPDIFKPKWQHSDPKVRRAAVAGLDDADLIASLARICTEDEDAGVRSAAATRITDLAVLMRAQRTEQDASVSTTLKRRISDLASATDQNRPELALRMELVQESKDRDLLERIAEHAPEPELRIAALQKASRQGFVGDRAIQDPDPAVRKAAAELIDQASTLQRVIDETRTRDKVLHQALLQRQKAELLAAGDPETTRAEALTLCTELEKFALEHRFEAATVPSDLLQRWSNLSDVPADLAARFERDVKRVTTVEAPRPAEPPAPPPKPEESPPEPVSAEPEVPAPLAGLLDELKTLAASTSGPPPGKRLEQLQKRLSQLARPAAGAARSACEEAASLLDKLSANAARAEEKLSQGIERGRELLQRYEQQLEEGLLGKALETRQALQELGSSLRAQRDWKPISDRAASLHGRLRELRDWQHWSNDKIRKQLIKEMEVLPKADLHPDAMLERIKALQQQWKELEQSEQIPGEQHFAAAPWMWRKFRAAGNAAFNAAKPFLEKRTELQEKHQAEIQERIDRLKDLRDAESTDWSALGKALRQARSSFRELDTVPAKARKKLASRLRKAIEQANALLESHQDEVEKEKRKLIRAAEQLPFIEDRDEAINKAKDLQAQWKAAGSLWRSRENPLWEAFRAPIDPLFEDLKAERQEQDAARAQNRAAQQTLCDELDAILAADDAKLGAAEGKVRGLTGAWSDIEHPDRKLRSQFDAKVRQFEQRLEDIRTRREEETRKRWWAKAGILHEWESARIAGSLTAAAEKKLSARWPEGESGTATDRELDSRLEALQQDQAPGAFDPETEKVAADLCIQLEFLSGLASPVDEKERRMQYQVKRLAQTMSGEGKQLSALEEARQAEQQWLTLPPMPAEVHQRLAPRIQAALKEIYGHL